MVSVHQQDKVDTGCWYIDIGDRTQNWLNIASRGGALSNDIQHLLLDVDCQHFAPWYQGSHSEYEVAGSGADVGNHVVGTQAQRGDKQVGALIAFTRTAFQPTCSLVTHDLGNLATHVAFPDTVATGGGIYISGLRKCIESRRFP